MEQLAQVPYFHLWCKFEPGELWSVYRCYGEMEQLA